MSSFWVYNLYCKFNCNKRTFNKINKEFTDWCDKKGYYQYFTLSYESKKKHGLLDLKDGDVGRHFDEELIGLDNICSKYETYLKGTYTGEAEGDAFRTDIDGSGEAVLDSEDISWLLEYPAKKIREIKKYAEKHYS